MAQTSGDTCEFNRFDSSLNQFTFSSVTTTDIVYGNDITNNVARVYQPVGDQNSCRPVVIWTHGGGFYTGSYLEAKTTDLMIQLARKGYVAISIRYRLWPTSPSTNQEYQEAMIRGVQDMLAAVRYIKSNASTFGIDSSLVFLGGSSAGAIIANHATFMDEAEAFSLALANQGGNFQVSTPSNYSSISTNVAGCVTQAGALWDLNFLNNETTPWGAVHNTSDGVVPYNSGGGSQQISNALQTLGVPAELKLTNSPGLHTPFPSTPSAAYVDTFNLATFQQLRDILQIDQTSNITLSGSSLYASPEGIGYQWYLDGTPIPFASGPTYEPQQNGNYTVQIQFCTSCYSTSAPFSISTLSMNDEKYSFIIFNNPVDNELTLKNVKEESILSIYDQLGKKVLEKYLVTNENTVDVSSLSKGTYLIYISSLASIQNEILIKK